MSTASPEVVVLVATAVAAGVYAFVCGVRGDRRALELRRWISEHRPDSWQTLPWIYRSGGGLGDVSNRDNKRLEPTVLRTAAHPQRWALKLSESNPFSSEVIP